MTTPANKQVNLQSTKQALEIMRDMREKRRKENPATIFQLVKSIHTMLCPTECRKGEIQQHTISSEDYLLGSRDTIEDMLVVVRNRVGEVVEQVRKNPQESESTNNEDKVQELELEVSKQQQEIRKLTQHIKTSEQQAKTMQIKLLNNLKRLSVDLQEKDNQLIEFNKIMGDKNEEIQNLTKLNEKQYKKIRKLQQQVNELQIQLQEKVEEIDSERACVQVLERQLKTMDQKLQQMRDRCQQLQDKLSQPQSPTDPNPKQQRTPTPSTPQQQKTSSILTQSKQTKYIESIQRLTFELGEAYQKINDLTSQDRDRDCQRQASGEVGVYDVGSCDAINGKMGKLKLKSKSGYFSTFLK